MSLFLRWQEAVFFSTEPLEPISGHYVVDAVTQGARHQTKDTQPRPRTIEFTENDQRCVRFCVRSLAVDDNVGEVQCVGADSELFGKLLTVWLSGRGELDIICRFVLKYEPDPSTAKDAVSVEYNDDGVFVAHSELGYHGCGVWTIRACPDAVPETSDLDTLPMTALKGRAAAFDS